METCVVQLIVKDVNYEILCTHVPANTYEKALPLSLPGTPMVESSPSSSSRRDLFLPAARGEPVEAGELPNLSNRFRDGDGVGADATTSSSLSTRSDASVEDIVICVFVVSHATALMGTPASWN